MAKRRYVEGLKEYSISVISLILATYALGKEYLSQDNYVMVLLAASGFLIHSRLSAKVNSIPRRTQQCLNGCSEDEDQEDTHV